MPASSTILRAYRPADFEILYQIDRVCFPAAIAYGRSELESYLRLEGARCLLAEVAGNIGGFILTSLSCHTGHIITLDVLDACRRRGVGSNLLRASEADAASRGARRMILETATTNKPAIAFWKRHGYRETGTVKDYYGRGLDAFEMEKSLTAPAH